MKLTSRRCQILLYVWVVVVIGLTTYPWVTFVTHSHPDKIIWVPFQEYPLLIGDIVGNILLFVPIGFFFILSNPWPLKKSLLFRALFICIALSFLIEGSQIFNHTRFPSTTDFLSNLVGGIFGLALGVLWFCQKSGVYWRNAVFASLSKS